MKKGFTLIELLAVIVILAIIAIIAVPIVLNLINDAQIKKYKTDENSMKKAAEFYLIEQQKLLENEIVDQEISLDTLITTNKIEQVKDSGNGGVCEGKVIVTNNNISIKYKACLKCSNYVTSGCGYTDEEEPEEEEPVLPDVPVITLPEGYIGIYAKEDIINVSNDLTAKYALMANIDLTGETWTPIGTSSTRFTGTLDGQGFKITGLAIDSTSSYQGLFGYVGTGATVQNLEIEGASVKGGAHAGILAGNVSGATITNIIVDSGSVTGTNYLGGLIGYISGTTAITGVSVINTAITGTSSSSTIGRIGGLIGGISSTATIERTYTTGTVTGSANKAVGGLIGEISANTNLKVIIRDSYSAANVTGNTYVGGLIGNATPITLENTYAIGQVTATATSNIGALVGSANYYSIKDSYWTREASGQEKGVMGEAKLLSELAREDGYAETWDFENVWAIEEGTTLAYLRNMPVPDEVYKTANDYVTFESGTGTSDDPYIIKTAEQLQFIKYKLEGHYKLGNNIDLTGRTWTPIGTSSTQFTGTLDGQGYKITGLTIDATSSYQGLFGYVGNGAVIQNLEIEGANVKGAYYVGALAGQTISTTTIKNIIIDSSNITGTYQVGGLIGEIYSTTNVSDVAVINTNVTGTSSSDTLGKIGGLVGVISGQATIERTYTTGTVTGSKNKNIGGLIGSSEGTSSQKITIKDSYSAATVTGNTYVGGLLGNGTYITLENTYAIGQVTATGTSNIGALVGYLSGTIKNSYWTREASGQEKGTSGEPKLLSELARQDGYAETWDFENVWAIEEGTTLAYLRNMPVPDEVYKTANDYVTFESGKGTVEDPYIIKTAEQLQFINYKLEGHYKLGTNIDLTGETWTPIGTSSTRFTGTFDGQGYKITGLTIDSTSSGYQGLFGYISNGATVQNLEIEGANVNTRYYSGILSGYIYGATTTIKNIIIDGGSITGTYYVGALAGEAQFATITDISVINVDVKGTYNNNNTGHVGGLIGSVKGTTKIERASTTGTVTGYYNVGGLIGYVSASSGATTLVKDSYSASKVSGTSYLGGLIGYGKYTTLENTYAIGEVVGTSSKGGLTGYFSGGSTTSSYWNTETTGQTTGTTGTGYTTEQMMSQENYVNWDFYDETTNPTGIWTMSGSYPTLK